MFRKTVTVAAVVATGFLSFAMFCWYVHAQETLSHGQAENPGQTRKET